MASESGEADSASADDVDADAAAEDSPDIPKRQRDVPPISSAPAMPHQSDASSEEVELTGVVLGHATVMRLVAKGKLKPPMQVQDSQPTAAVPIDNAGAEPIENALPDFAKAVVSQASELPANSRPELSMHDYLAPSRKRRTLSRGKPAANVGTENEPVFS